MAWVRIHDGAMQNQKITALSDSAFRLWVRGLSYCQTALTDGLIPNNALKQMGAKRRDVATLSTPQVNGMAPLWEPHDDGFQVHHYLHWNDCREKVKERQQKSIVRKVFFTDTELRAALRARDGDICRYCGVTVLWTDRRGAQGATYDHVDPDRAYDEIDNLVVACRGCNSKKKARTPVQAGMSLRDAPNQNQVGPRSVLDKNQIKPRSDLEFIKTPNQTKPNQTKISSDPTDPQRSVPSARSKRPIFRGQRFTVFDWMLDDCLKTLGNYADSFDLHAWFFDLDEQARRTDLVIPQRDGGAWLQQQLLAEATRRGLPIASSLGKFSTRMARALATIEAETRAEHATQGPSVALGRAKGRE